MPQLTQQNINLAPASPGIYRIYAYSNNNIAIPIRKFADTDNSGLIYIGRTVQQTLQIRIYNFYATSRPNARTTNHSGAVKYRAIPIIQQVLGDHYLFFDFEVCANPVHREGELLREYACEFGEYPLLNG